VLPARASFRGPTLLALAGACVALACLLFAAVPVARADARSDYLVRLLQTSTAFRVRAQAAISLGSGLPEPAVTAALTAALRDENAAVRAAAASSLGRVGDASAVAALRAVERDSEAAVRTAATTAIAAIQSRGTQGAGVAAGGGTTGGGTTGGGTTGSGPARYYVGIGRPNVTGTLSPSVTAGLRGVVERRLATIGGIAVAPDGESVSAAQAELRRRSLAGFYLDISITIESLPAGAIRARVSVVVQDYPGRNVRSMLSGSATISGASSADGTLLEAAIGSALNRLPAALAATGR